MKESPLVDIVNATFKSCPQDVLLNILTTGGTIEEKMILYRCFFDVEEKMGREANKELLDALPLLQDEETSLMVRELSFSRFYGK